MPTVPAKQTGATEPVETVAEKFRRLASVWRAETAYHSSSSDLVAHPAFPEIVGMGPPVIRNRPRTPPFWAEPGRRVMPRNV